MDSNGKTAVGFWGEFEHVGSYGDRKDDPFNNLLLYMSTQKLRTPKEKDNKKEGRSLEEGKYLYRFQSEFAKKFGPYRRGRTVEMGEFDGEKDTEGMHKHFLTIGDK